MIGLFKRKRIAKFIVFLLGITFISTTINLTKLDNEISVLGPDDKGKGDDLELVKSISRSNEVEKSIRTKVNDDRRPDEDPASFDSESIENHPDEIFGIAKDRNLEGNNLEAPEESLNEVGIDQGLDINRNSTKDLEDYKDTLDENSTPETKLSGLQDLQVQTLDNQNNLKESTMSEEQIKDGMTHAKYNDVTSNLKSEKLDLISQDLDGKIEKESKLRQGENKNTQLSIQEKNEEINEDGKKKSISEEDMDNEAEFPSIMLAKS